jgi:hypothetical protein
VLSTGDSCGRDGISAALYNASEPRSTLVSISAHRRILFEVNRSLELHYGIMVIVAVAIGACSALLVGSVLLSGWVAASLAGFGGFVVGLMFSRSLLIAPAKRRARSRLASIRNTGGHPLGAELDEWPLVQAVLGETTPPGD